MEKRYVQFGIMAVLMFITATNLGAATKSAQRANQKKTLVLVVTCQRSGSSAMTGVLKILGLDLGKRLMGAKPANVKGHFEDLATVTLNDSILKNFKTYHNDPRPLHIDWEKQLAPLTAKVKKHLGSIFKSRTVFGIKDPRVTLLLPAYVNAAQELGIELKVIRMYRDTQEIVASLQVRDKVSYENAQAIAARYLTALEEYCPLCDHIVVRFDDLITNTSGVIDAINDYIPSLKKYSDVRSEIMAFLDPALKHHGS